MALIHTLVQVLLFGTLITVFLLRVKAAYFPDVEFKFFNSFFGGKKK